MTRRAAPIAARAPAGSASLLPGAALVLVLAAAGLLVPAGEAAPQSASSSGSAGERSGDTEAPTRSPFPTLGARRVAGIAPVIDGDLSDPAWRDAAVASGFVQMVPREGEPATEPTEARILYDDGALYVAVRAWDSDPESIVGQLTRRDEGSYSDRVWITIDSFFDRRTAFRFGVNPVGVKFDAYLYDDVREDSGWDAVWEVATAVDAEGWTAEFRIPLSQLRFSGAPVQTWGLNVGRHIARRNETAHWAPLSPGEQARVSRAGHLADLRELRPGSRMEVMPYTAASVARSPGDPENPFWSETAGSVRVGGDFRMGVTNDLTLDVTLNPDFGQVEADPAEVNLSAFESFFGERRPFFLEGAGIFRMGIGLGDGDGESQGLFYSRRIGRAPQGGPPPDAEWVDVPARTRILGAAKLSGKTSGGWSIGVLNATTDREEARAVVGGERLTTTVEPRANYSVVRLQRDFREGGTSVGGIATGTLRDGAAADALALHRRAWSGGVDLRHRFAGGTLELRSFLLGSRVEGSPAALRRTQASSARYFQRPDAGHVEFDPDATRMEGLAGKLELHRIAGGPWRFASFTHFRSPGFEVNDLGFMPSADFITQWLWVQRRSDRPGRFLRSWAVNLNGGSHWNFDGDHTGLGGNVNWHGMTLGHLQFNGGVNLNEPGLSTTLLRGGPSIRTARTFNGWSGFGTDARRSVQLHLQASGFVRPETDSWSLHLGPSLRWRPSSRTTLRVGPSFQRRVEDRQWVERVETAGGPEYVFGRLEQNTLAMTLRTDLALSPTLSLQLYAQPFVSSGGFSGFKRVADARARAYGDRFEWIDAALVDGRYEADLDGDQDPETFRNPDFSVMQFRSNAVLRWEYRPGSTLFLVWAQGRDAFDPSGGFRAGRRLDDLFSSPAENVLMLKVSYWLGS